MADTTPHIHHSAGLGAAARALKRLAVLSRTEAFAKHLDAHLACLPDTAARRAFLERELDKWQIRYNEFQERVVAGVAPDGPDDPTAFDYALTLADIGARLTPLTVSLAPEAA